VSKPSEIVSRQSPKFAFNHGLKLLNITRKTSAEKMLSDECDTTVKKRLKSGRSNIVGNYPIGFPQGFNAVTAVGISRLRSKSAFTGQSVHHQIQTAEK
jgi:hypothetical protein